ncbi:TonB-dependent receptor plug domain-containing protein [Flavobacterium beibuense]|uniref:TonB-dependent receptor n=1 Tax=Flavobacterium beibuense TaxID=657326 RepID=A0A444W483_9FLAO|nr:TonB-dependent receptor [Flavobacterium beibuense]RYJ40508.1 TonB-dependent receptor [Flavobacterium beibuense]
MTLKKIILVFTVLLCQYIWAQQDTIVQLKEVVISDTQLKNFTNTQSILTLNDSVININQSSLTSLLNYNTTVYFKENGLGMVSSPSFRGTTAQQTAVVWNGININSQLNGQTDFNVINTRDFDAIDVRAGGGSVIYGSSAIGGSIHLNNQLEYKKKFTNSVRANYGSFNTFGANYTGTVADDKFSAALSITRNSSDNDYDYVGKDGHNLNGQYYNNSASATLGYKINQSNVLTLYSYLFDGERHFSLIFPSETRTKYYNLNTRNMLEWTGNYGRFTSKLKGAFLSEKYKYYDNIDDKGYDYGKSESVIGNYDLLFRINDKIKLNSVFNFTQTKGYGSNLEGAERSIGSAGLLFSHAVTQKLLYEAGLRKEATNNYDSPLLYSAGVRYRVSDFYLVRVNGSKNFRIPTFQDLYWQGSGNTDLKPESSVQGEIGNEFTIKNVSLTLTGYYIKLKDMLRWLPTGSVWRPQNTDRVRTYGLEAAFKYTKNFNNHQFAFNAVYGYTKSEDETTGYQLIYVPYNKASGALSYNYKKLSAYYQFLYVGEVFTRSDNNSRYNIDAYNTGNVGVEYNFGKSKIYRLGAQVLNVWNADYVNVDSRQMPGRNYNIYLTLKL